jgi:glycosyltransferase involved in cell wall biosynthesis
MTEQVSTEVFRRWMERATAAVQLRDSWNGEASGTVGECIVAGVPLVVSDIGWMHELPDDCAVKVGAGLAPPELGELLADLVAAPGRRRAMVEAQRRHAPYLSFARGAADLVKLLFPDG